MNKTKAIQLHLIEKGNITSWEAIKEYGATRLSAIIYNLRNKYGMNIITETILSSYSSNSMKSLVLEGEKGLIYQITSSKNERELLNNDILLDDYNLPIIDLGECEDLLRQEYNIAEEDSLIIVKKENSANKSSEKNIEYEIFEPYNKTKLNMSICSQVEINMYVKLN